jgi:hypothetical protein
MYVPKVLRARKVLTFSVDDLTALHEPFGWVGMYVVGSPLSERH